MSRAKNTIQFSDLSTTPIRLKYSASYLDNEFSSVGISILKGINYPVTSDTKVSSYKLNYDLIRQLYYKTYISGTLLNSGSSYDSSLQSTAASGSNDDDFRYFPTESGAEIKLLYIPRNVFGEQIARNSVALTTPRYNIIDDGNGNLIDTYALNTHVGNAIYSQAFLIITNPNYLCYFTNLYFDYSIVDESFTPIVPSPTPSITPSVTPSISITPSVSMTPSVTPSVSVTPSISVTQGASPTPTNSVTPSISITPSVSVTPSNSVTPSITKTPSISVTPSVSITPSVSMSLPMREVIIYAKQVFEGLNNDVYVEVSFDGGSTYTVTSPSFSDSNCVSRITTSVLAGNSITVRARGTSTSTIHPTTKGTSDCPVYNTSTAECTWVLTPTQNFVPNNYYFTIDVNAPTTCL